MKLVSMIDFVFNMRQNKSKDNIRRFWSCEKYANFLNQPLNIGMFVPAIEVGGKWEVLEMPTPNISDSGNWNFQARENQYQQAKDRVLFEGLECVGVGNGFITIIKGNVMFTASDVNIIEDLISFEPTLTARGQELSGLNK